MIEPNVAPFEALKLYYTKHIYSPVHVETTKLYDALRIHADGEYPTHLIDSTRPSESREIKRYRKETYQPHTKATVSKVVSSLYKIRRSQDWSITYDKDEVAKINAPENESLKDYCEDYFPYFRSITNWTFSVLLKNYLIDANAVIFVIPLNTDKAPEEFYKPFPFIFNSNDVIVYREGDYAVVRSQERCTYTMGNVTREGSIFYTLDKMEFVKYEERFSESDKKMILVETSKWEHNLGKVPMLKTGGIYLKTENYTAIWESRIASMVPRLNEFVTMFSDFKAEIVQHVHSTRWVMATQDCTHCNGAGRISTMVNSATSVIVCPTCNGTSKVFTSPYDNIVLMTPTKMNEGEAPLQSGPPAGYIQKADVALMTELMNKIINEQTYYALSAINMEFLAETPLNQSGTAKAQDKDELNNFVHAIAEDIVRIMDSIYYFTNIERYGYVTNTPIADQLPTINVPERYDLLSTTYAIEQLKLAKDASINPVIINAMEIELSRREFNYDEEVSDEITCMLEVDPFPGKTTDEIGAQLMNKGITELDYIMWCNLVTFVRAASEADEEFYELPIEERKAILTEMAKKVQEENSFMPTTPPAYTPRF
jgi:hypothetical protein